MTIKDAPFTGESPESHLATEVMEVWVALPWSIGPGTLYKFVAFRKVMPCGPCGPGILLAGPVIPVAPVNPRSPCGPAGPVAPVRPLSPCGPGAPPAGPGGPCDPAGPWTPLVPLVPLIPGGPWGPCWPGGPWVPVLLLSFLSLSNLTCLQNSTELTKNPSSGPVLHSYLFTSVGYVLYLS